MSGGGAPADYAELHCLSNFSFLRGASHPEELIERAHALGYAALALTDECSVAGVVRAHLAARERAFKLIVGAEFRLVCGLRFVALAIDRHGYGRLCRLITRGRRAAPKGEYRLERTDVEALLEQCLLLWLPGRQPDATEGAWLAERFPGRVWIAVELLRSGGDRERLVTLTRLGSALCLPLVASGDVHMHVRARRALQDTLTAIRLNVPLAAAGWHLHPNGERHLREPARLERLYPGELLAESVAIAARCRFCLEELRYEYPRELVPAGHTPASHLRELTEAGAQRHWPHGVPQAVRTAIEHELTLIADLRYEPYFLTVHDIVAWARSRGILCQGRGSAANSVVCYCLGVTSVDPARMSLLFERFISRERNEPPDIDIDFEHERREEVIQYVYGKYGRERAALAATVITYRPRSALRDLGKALGLDPLQAARLAGAMQWWDGNRIEPERIREAGFDPANPLVGRLLALARELVGFPRHLSQHVGGFVISEGALEELVPIENAAMPERTVIQWDKDDLDDLGLLKVDLLGLGMLSALRRAFALVESFRGRPVALGQLPAEDPRVYAMISRGDTVGVFQIESRAQMAMLPRLQPRTFYDLVIEVAIVRPGPIQGDMVHPYLRRRAGEEPVSYPSEEVRRVLERTLGVPIFQEQVMQLAIVAAGFTAGEADRLRRAMAAWKRRGGLEPFQQRLIGGMRARGYGEEFAERLFRQILGFGEYGFPECLVGETRIVDADTGRWLTIDDVIAGKARLQHTLACDENRRLQRRRVVALVPSGERPVWRLRTALGHTVLATAEHPFLTIDGWRQLGALRVGDFVAAARSVPVVGRRHWRRHRILVLADLIAAGNLRHPSTFYFYTSEPWHRDEFVTAVERFPNTRAVIERRRSGFSVRVRRIDRDRPIGAVSWVRSLGIWGHGAREKHLPPEVFELRNGDIALLLARLWERDGGSSLRGTASYDGASRRLALEVQHLLLRLGIVSRLYRRRRACRGREVEHYTVTITGSEALRAFWRAIGRRFLDPKKRRQSKALASGGRGRMSRDVIPAAIRTQRGSSDVFWDRVVTIEPQGRSPTYDLQIEGNHNFLASNLVVHNSHATSFALLVYDSAWLKCHEPAVFTCALLNSLPMGFYAPAQLVRDAQAHGVEVRPVDVSASGWDCTLERRADGEPALRLGMRLVKSLSQAAAGRIVAARTARGFASVQELTERCTLDRGDLEALAAAGALASLSGNRHFAFWEVAGAEQPLPLAPRSGRTSAQEEGRPLLAMPSEGEEIVADYRAVGLTLGRHPLALLRGRLQREGLLATRELADLAHGAAVRTAGIVITRQRPSSASGVTFVTLEDETGHVNLIVWKSVGEAQRRPLLEARLLEVHGELQRQGIVVHVIAQRLVDRSALLGRLLTQARDFR